MPTGKVKWFDARKGFGFIQPMAVGQTSSYISVPLRAPGSQRGTKASGSASTSPAKAATNAANLKLA